MAGTYSQVYIQVVFAVKGRANLIDSSWKQDLYKYMAGIISSKGHKAIIINGVSDHVHLFIGLKPAMAISDLIRDVKNNSSKYINEQNWITGRFSWQEGFGVFSYSESQIDRVYQYIKNQEIHHSKQSFRDEYTELLEKFNIPYEERFLFDWL